MGSRRQSFSMIGREAGRREDRADIRAWVNSTDSNVSGSAPRTIAPSAASRSRAPSRGRAESTVHPHSSVSGSHRGSVAGGPSRARDLSPFYQFGSGLVAHRPYYPPVSRSGQQSVAQYQPSQARGRSSSVSRVQTLPSGRASSVSRPAQSSVAGPGHQSLVARSQYPPLSASSSAHRSVAPSRARSSHPPSSAYSGRRSSVSGTSGYSGTTVTPGSRALGPRGYTHHIPAGSAPGSDPFSVITPNGPFPGPHGQPVCCHGKPMCCHKTTITYREVHEY